MKKERKSPDVTMADTGPKCIDYSLAKSQRLDCL